MQRRKYKICAPTLDAPERDRRSSSSDPLQNSTARGSVYTAAEHFRRLQHHVVVIGVVAAVTSSEELCHSMATFFSAKNMPSPWTHARNGLARRQVVPNVSRGWNVGTSRSTVARGASLVLVEQQHCSVPNEVVAPGN